MARLSEIISYLDAFYDIASIPQDKSNNGLQIEGRADVHCVVGGVDACVAFYEEAVARGAELLIVHHGESWGPGLQTFTGTTARRFRLLFKNDLSLYAVHLPMDAHRDIGHNAVIARKLLLQDTAWFARYAGVEIGVHGSLPVAQTADALAQSLHAILDTECRVFDFHCEPISRVGIISGAGAGALQECAKLGLHCLVTGECDHTHYHQVRELGLCLITAGHYRTEVPGVVAVLDVIRDGFGVDCAFIDIPSGL